jgi:hypothetical protein
MGVRTRGKTCRRPKRDAGLLQHLIPLGTGLVAAISANAMATGALCCSFITHQRINSGRSLFNPDKIVMFFYKLIRSSRHTSPTE